MKRIISVVSALILAYIVGKWAFTRHIYHGPDSNDIKRDVYYDANIGCYKITPITYICPFGRYRN